MPDLITSHAWRTSQPAVGADGPRDDRPCAFMNCGRLRAEHGVALVPLCDCRVYDRDISTHSRCYCGHDYDSHLDDGLGPCFEAAR
jgi:hypothetical protein